MRVLSSDYNNIVTLKNIIVTVTKHYWDCTLTNGENIGNYFYAQQHDNNNYVMAIVLCIKVKKWINYFLKIVPI